MAGVRYGDPPSLMPRPTRLLGRDGELETIGHLLSGSEVRLLTLTGPAGVGKTRLALEVGARMAESFPQKPAFVDLAQVRDPRDVLLVMVQKLGLQGAGRDDPLPRLQTYLRDRAVLIILDNFERVLSAAANVADLLVACPTVRFLVTSRSPLQLQWEQILRVEPLPVPDLDNLPGPAELAEIPSVSLFLERARARQATFTLNGENARMAAELCRRLDGLPLAIELAAARLNVLPLSAILLRLEDRLQVLHWEAHDLPDRHRSLHTAIDWSYQLLSEDEQRLFRHLGVFVGQVSLDAISAVVNSPDKHLTLEWMASLAEKSLVLPGQSGPDPGELSFGILETIREYAREQLEERGELEAAQSRHAHYHLELAERANPQLTGRQQHSWFSRLEHRHDNLRAALRWLLDRGQAEAALRLAIALGWFWWTRGYHIEGWRWLEEALTSAPAADPALRTKALIMAGLMLMYRGDVGRSKAMLEDALSLAQQRQDPVDIAEALTYLGGHAATVGDWTECVRSLTEAMERWHELEEQGDQRHDFQIGVTLGYLGAAAAARGEYDQAVNFGLASLARSEARDDMRTASVVRFYLALSMRGLGDLPRTLELMREGFRGSRIYQDRSLLSLGVEVTLLLCGETADPEKRARLLEVGFALQQVVYPRSGALEQAWGCTVTAVREQVRQAPRAEGHRRGQPLCFDETVELALQLLEDAVRTQPISPSKARECERASPLTGREREVLRLVADGLPDKQIGRNLAIAERTVRRHLTSILNKLGASNRAQAVAVALQRGFL